MNTFYIGNKLSNVGEFENKVKCKHIESKDSDVKLRRGRVWHGRPPVKIVEKYE